MKIIYSLILFLSSQVLLGQAIATGQFGSNNFTWNQNSNGLMFYNSGDGMPGLEAPTGSNIHAIFSHSLWVAGVDSEGVIHVAAPMYCSSEPFCEYGTGPLMAAGVPETNSETEAAFNRFWVIRQSDVDDHMAYFECLNDNGCDVNILFPDGYIIPEDFITWPAQGDVDAGYAEYLAPFVDWNDNGIYDAQNGDYPLVCGNLTTYIVNNDASVDHSDSQGLPLGIEVHTTVYTFDSQEDYLFNTLFVQHKIINRSSNTYDDTYVGTFTDFDLGNPNDDYIGTDVQRSMLYVYNGNETDGPSSSGPGYGSDLGVLGIKYFDGPSKDANGQDDQPLSPEYDTYGNQASGWGDDVVDNERLGLAYALAFNNPGGGFPPSTTDPASPVEFYNYMTGVWKDGIFLTHGGNGYSPFNEFTTRYMYPGLTDPLNEGTDGETPIEENWTEETAGNPPGDRRMMGSSGPFTFAPGAVQYFDYAVIFARDSHVPEEEPLETLRTYADQVVGMQCGILPEVVVSNRDVIFDGIVLNVFPNPAQDRFVIETGSTLEGRYSVTDLLGRTILQGNLQGNRTEISSTHFAEGIYLVRIESEGKVAVKKLVVKN